MTTLTLFPEVLAQLDPQKVRLPEARPNNYFKEQLYRSDHHYAGRGDKVRLYLMDNGIYPTQHEPKPDCAEIDARAERAEVGNARAVLQKLMFELDSDDVIALSHLAQLFANQPKDTPSLIKICKENVAQFRAMYAHKFKRGK